MHTKGRRSFLALVGLAKLGECVRGRGRHLATRGGLLMLTLLKCALISYALLAGLCCIVAPYLVDNEACRPETKPKKETTEK